ncbi:MAG: response regulator [Bryobacteraceae bacterium]
MRFSSPTNQPKPARILLVDDNKLGLSARRSVLAELGYSVTTAPGGLEALEQFERGKFDLLVTDYKMPHMNGVELIGKVRAVEPSLPVIVISGYVEALDLSETTTGADAVIPKSANEVSHLVRAVARLVKRKPARKPPATVKAAPRIPRANGTRQATPRRRSQDTK